MTATIETSKGKLKGTERDGVLVFLGIPFARPPMGELRWRPPRPVQPWLGLRDATRPGPAAPQPGNPMYHVAGVTGPPGLHMSEDCLCLNVWTPAADGGRRPVMVSIHGGGLLFGSGTDKIFDGRNLALRGDVVMVTINYRLGALGALAHPALADEESGVAGNFNLLDQIAALAWVRDEIAAFGGDPQNVTIFGESGGGGSVATLMATPRASDLFQRGIVQSGATAATSFQAMADFTERFARELGLSPGEIPHLREVPVDRILEAQTRTNILAMTQRGSGFTVDGVVLPKPPLDMIRDGSSRGKPLLTGTTRDEAKLGLGLALGQGVRLPEVTEQDLRRYAERVLSGADETGASRAERTIEAIRRARTARGESVEPIELRAALETELMYRRPCIQLLEAHLTHTPDAYAYLFTWESKAFDGIMGACHGLDVPVTYGNFGGEHFTGRIEERDRRFAECLQDAWIAFARASNPSHRGLGEWPRYSTLDRATMLLGLQCGVETAPRESERRVWAEVPASAQCRPDVVITGA